MRSVGITYRDTRSGFTLTHRYAVVRDDTYRKLDGTGRRWLVVDVAPPGGTALDVVAAFHHGDGQDKGRAERYADSLEHADEHARCEHLDGAVPTVVCTGCGMRFGFCEHYYADGGLTFDCVECNA